MRFDGLDSSLVTTSLVTPFGGDLNRSGTPAEPPFAPRLIVERTSLCVVLIVVPEYVSFEDGIR